MAKHYYEIGGDTEPTAMENTQHLKDELLHQLSIQHAVDVFTETAISKKVSIYGDYIYNNSKFNDP